MAKFSHFWKYSEGGQDQRQNVTLPQTAVNFLIGILQKWSAAGASWISRWSELLETGLAFIILFILKINVPTLERNKKGDLVIQVGFKTYKKSVIKRSFLATLFITFCLTPQHFYRRQFQGPSNRKWLDGYLYW